MDRISDLEQEIATLRKTLQVKEKELQRLKKENDLTQDCNNLPRKSSQPYSQHTNGKNMDILPKWAIERYSRQILLSDIGVHGQDRLCGASVLIVGAGGLGCPAALFLAGAGVGEIGIVDYDTVDLTNIHRQILHGETDQDVCKVTSAAETLRNINSRITVTPYNIQLDSSNAMEIVSQYDIVLDCSDNVPTRYLLNDACVLAKVPLISGSALKMEGQITIYGYRTRNGLNDADGYVGPCYRCLFPTPPPAEAVGSCSSNGVAGPVPGVIGALQALEAIKFIVGHAHEKLLVERMLLFDGEDMTFRTVKLRPRNPECAVCSENPTITKLMDYELFCNAQAKEKRKIKKAETNQRQKRLEEKVRRMTGRSYLGFRLLNDGKKKWIQNVPKGERRMGPSCNSEYCSRAKKFCSQFTEDIRKDIFNNFWNNLDWIAKKNYVKSLIDNVPARRRRINSENSRKGDSKVYHLTYKDERVQVCRVMFLNTLGLKEAMVRCWLVTVDKPKLSKMPVKTLSVDSYIDSLPKMQSKCQFCRNTDVVYINSDVKNQFQLYKLYLKDMKARNISPASRKTFSKVFSASHLRIFKPKNDLDICDLVPDHNILPSLQAFQNVEAQPIIYLNDGKCQSDCQSGCQNDVIAVNYYNSDQW